MKLDELLLENSLDFYIDDEVDVAEVPLAVSMFGKVLNAGKDCWIRYGKLSGQTGPLLHIVSAKVDHNNGNPRLIYTYKVSGQKQPSRTSFTFSLGSPETWKLTRYPKGPRLKKDRWILDVD
jgi:hypothetical protein